MVANQLHDAHRPPAAGTPEWGTSPPFQGIYAFTLSLLNGGGFSKQGDIVVLGQTDVVRSYGLSPTARRQWDVGGFLSIMLVSLLTTLMTGSMLDVLRNVFIWLLVYWLAVISVDLVVSSLRTRRSHVADPGQLMSGTGRSRPWHPSQGPPPQTAEKSWRPYELDPESPSVN